ncbi:MAG: hypothetical protein Tsb002_23500 [Wenzhouxiangellaceae bacterium]
MKQQQSKTTYQDDFQQQRASWLGALMLGALLPWTGVEAAMTLETIDGYIVYSGQMDDQVIVGAMLDQGSSYLLMSMYGIWQLTGDDPHAIRVAGSGTGGATGPAPGSEQVAMVEYVPQTNNDLVISVAGSGTGGVLLDDSDWGAVEIVPGCYSADVMLYRRVDDQLAEVLVEQVLFDQCAVAP